jgi:hypothetical protein
MVLLVVNEILTRVSLNNLIMNFVCFPIYVNLAHIFCYCLGLF